jgi:hypothetical protein
VGWYLRRRSFGPIRLATYIGEYSDVRSASELREHNTPLSSILF